VTKPIRRVTGEWTPDELRAAVQARLDGSKREATIECPLCHGDGKVVRMKGLTQQDLATAIGVHRTSMVNFLAGKSGLRMPETLRLLGWLAHGTEAGR